MEKSKIIVGIDPDVDKNGVATVDRETRHLTLHSLAFFDALSFLIKTKNEAEAGGYRYLVVIEAGHLNQSNWHTSRFDSARLAAAKGENAGRNHQVGILLQQACEYYGIHYTLQKPLRKCWKGKDGKITHAELASFTALQDKKSNQEERDAALLAWTFADLPIRIINR